VRPPTDAWTDRRTALHSTAQHSTWRADKSWWRVRVALSQVQARDPGLPSPPVLGPQCRPGSPGQRAYLGAGSRDSVRSVGRRSGSSPGKSGFGPGRVRAPHRLRPEVGSSAQRRFRSRARSGQSAPAEPFIAVDSASAEPPPPAASPPRLAPEKASSPGPGQPEWGGGSAPRPAGPGRALAAARGDADRSPRASRDPRGDRPAAAR
jgi:hypothetical protein